MTNKKGRPSKYDPTFCGRVVSLMTKGLSKEAVAGNLGISRDTLYEWCQAHEKFSDSIKIGEAKSRYYWEKIGMDGMLGKIKDFRAAVWIFIMKNRFGWRDNVNIQEEATDSRWLPQNEKDSNITDELDGQAEDTRTDFEKRIDGILYEKYCYERLQLGRKLDDIDLKLAHMFERSGKIEMALLKGQMEYAANQKQQLNPS